MMMKSIGLAAAAALILGIGPALADQRQGTHPNTQFAQNPGVVAHPPRYEGPAHVSKPDKGVWYYSEDLEQYAFPPHYTHVYGTRVSRSTSLFPPDPNQGAGS